MREHNVSGVICDRRVRVPDRGKMYEMVMRPAKLYGLVTVALIKRQAQLEVAELRML